MTGQEPTRTHHDPMQRLAKGKVLADRYRIVNLQGAGAMGIVYRALDETLGTDVALKILRPELIDRQDLLDRFRTELVLARQVSHRNVVRIHDIGVDGDIHFMTMDLVVGDSLRDVMRRRGALPQDEVIEIGTQLARAIAAAHSAGIIHRDLKPSNVMLSEDGRALVTDFGIARSLSATGITATGAVVGTPDYLSPEQAAGQEVDERADIFALGVILTEMLTGKLPFAEGSVSERIAHRISGRVIDPTRLEVDLPPWLAAVLRRCLDPEPARRFKSADDLAEALENRQAPRAPVRWRRPVLIGGLIVALAAGAAWVWRGWTPAVDSPPAVGVSTPARPILAILPMIDETGRPELAWLTTAAAEMVAEQLAESPDLTVVDPQRLLRVLRDLRMANDLGGDSSLRQVATLFNAQRVVRGRLRVVAGSLVLDAELVTVPERGDPSVVALEVEAVQIDRPGALVAALSAGVRRALEVGSAEVVVDSSNPDALRTYSQGSELLALGNAVDALPLLEQSVAADPRFAAAWLRLAEAREQLGQEAALGAAERAAELLEGSSGRLGFVARARRAALADDPETSQRILAELFERYPNDLETAIALGETYGQLGQFKEALEVLGVVAEASPGHPRAWYLLGKFSILSGDGRSAIDEYLVRALVLQNRLGNSQGQADVYNAFGVAFREQGDLDKAAENYDRAAKLRREIGDQRGYATTLRNLALIDMYRGQYTAARGQLEEALAIVEGLGDRSGIAEVLNDLGVLEEDGGNFRAALAHYRESLKARRELGDRSALAESLSNIGFVYYVLGELDNAGVYWQEALELFRQTENPIGELLVLQSLGQLHFDRGDWDESAAAQLTALEMSRETEFAPAVAVSLGNLGKLAHYQGRFAAALESYSEALELLESIEDVRGLTEFTLARASAELQLGLLAEAEADLDRARGWLAESVNHEQSAEERRLRAALEAIQGDTSAAAATLAVALKEAESAGGAATLLRARLEEARLARRQRRTAAAIAAATDVADRAATLELVLVELSARTLLVRSALGSGDLEAAGRELETALRLARRPGGYAGAASLFELQAELEDRRGNELAASAARESARAERERIEGSLDDRQRAAFAALQEPRW